MNFGYRIDLAEEQGNLVRGLMADQGLPASFYDAAPHLQGIGEGKTVVLHDAGKKVLGSFLRSQNQPRGTCTSRGLKRVLDLLQAVLIADRALPIEFKYLSHAVFYGAGREHAGMLGGNPNNDHDDGCTGAAVAWGAANVGALTNEDVGDNDDDDQLACLWGARGVPAEIKGKAKAHLSTNLTAIRSGDEGRDAVCSGRPFTVASNVGFAGIPGQHVFARDSEGRAHRGGSWNHQMSCTGYRGDKDWFLIDQSWGAKSPDGPTGSLEIPTYSFWINRSDMEAMIAQRDSWTFDGIAGWPAANLSWRL